MAITTYSSKGNKSLSFAEMDANWEILRSAANVSGVVLDIRDYGAIPATNPSIQGSASDAGVAIQAAHDTLPATGGVILLPPGVWSIKTPVQISKNGVVIQGMGIRASYIKPFSNADTTCMFKINATPGAATLQMTIRDCFFHGYTFNNGSAENWNGIVIDSTSYPFIDSILRNCWFSMSFSCPAIIRGGLSNSQIHDNVFELTSGCIHALGASGVGLYNTFIKNNLFWRVLKALVVDPGTYTGETSIHFNNNIIGSHYGGDAIQVFGGNVFINGLKFDVSTAWAGSGDSICAHLAGGVGYFKNISISQTGTYAAGNAFLTDGLKTTNTAHMYVSGLYANGCIDTIRHNGTGILDVRDSIIENSTSNGIVSFLQCDENTIVNNKIIRSGYGPAAAVRNGIFAKANTITIKGNYLLDDATSNANPITVAASTGDGYIEDNITNGGKVNGPLQISSSSPNVFVKHYATAKPTYGQYKRGSVLTNTNAAANGNIGWVNVVTGWANFGAIGAA